MNIDENLLRGMISPPNVGEKGGGIGIEGAGKKENIGDSFQKLLTDSVKKVNEDQKVADTAAEDLVTGKSQNIHEAMIALEKADVSFRLMMQVRNKLVEGLQEVMRMPV